MSPGSASKHKNPGDSDFHSSSEEQQAVLPDPGGLQCHSPTGKTHGAATGPLAPVRSHGRCLTSRKVAQLLRCQCDLPGDGPGGTLCSQPPR